MFAKYANNYSKVDEMKKWLISTGADRSYNESQGSTPKEYWFGSKKYQLDLLKLQQTLLDNPQWVPTTNYERGLKQQYDYLR
jgi:hypothetical protein